MSELTKIQWCDHTFNPWEGCTKVSPGCANCYAEARNHRFGLDNWGKGKPRRLTSEANWKQPLKWNAQNWQCEHCGWLVLKPAQLPSYESPNQTICPKCFSPLIRRRPKVFCASLADWLDAEVLIEWLARLLKLIHDTPNLDWLLLTKRPENWHRHGNQARGERNGRWNDGRFAERGRDSLGRFKPEDLRVREFPNHDAA